MHRLKTVPAPRRPEVRTAVASLPQGLIAGPDILKRLSLMCQPFEVLPTVFGFILALRIWAGKCGKSVEHPVALDLHDLRETLPVWADGLAPILCSLEKLAAERKIDRCSRVEYRVRQTSLESRAAQVARDITTVGCSGLGQPRGLPRSLNRSFYLLIRKSKSSFLHVRKQDMSQRQ